MSRVNVARKCRAVKYVEAKIKRIKICVYLAGSQLFSILCRVNLYCSSDEELCSKYNVTYFWNSSFEYITRKRS